MKIISHLPEFNSVLSVKKREFQMRSKGVLVVNLSTRYDINLKIRLLDRFGILNFIAPVIICNYTTIIE
jgi:hypothetical protein